jgi:hypothetical protein
VKIVCLTNCVVTRGQCNEFRRPLSCKFHSLQISQENRTYQGASYSRRNMTTVYRLTITMYLTATWFWFFHKLSFTAATYTRIYVELEAQAWGRVGQAPPPQYCEVVFMFVWLRWWCCKMSRCSFSRFVERSLYTSISSFQRSRRAKFKPLNFELLKIYIFHRFLISNTHMVMTLRAGHTRVSIGF